MRLRRYAIRRTGRVGPLGAGRDVERAALGRGLEHAARDVDDVRSKASRGPRRASFRDRLGQVLEPDAARLAGAAGGVRQLLPVAPVAPEPERARRTRSDRGARAPFAPVDLEIADVAVGRLEARDQVRGRAALELQRGRHVGRRRRLKRPPARGPIAIVRSQVRVEAKPATGATGPSRATIAVR